MKIKLIIHIIGRSVARRGQGANSPLHKEDIIFFQEADKKFSIDWRDDD